MAELETGSSLAGVSIEGSDLASLLQKEFKPKSEEAKNAARSAEARRLLRNSEDLPSVPGGVGKEPRTQQQVVPLSYGANMQPPPANPQPPDNQDNTDAGASQGEQQQALATALAAYERERFIAA